MLYMIGTSFTSSKCCCFYFLQCECGVKNEALLLRSTFTPFVCLEIVESAKHDTVVLQPCPEAESSRTRVTPSTITGLFVPTI